MLGDRQGSELAGTIARHPMHKLGGFFAKPRPFLPGDFVTTDQGTGLVHMAPDHGEDDFELCKAHGIDPVFAVDAGGFYRADWPWLGGQGSVINTKFNAPDGPICSDLREAGALLAASADFQHSYPHSWRSKAKVIYRCTPQWFIAHGQPSPLPAAGEGLRVSGAAKQRAGTSDIRRAPSPRPLPEGEGQRCASSPCRRSPTPASCPRKAATASGSMVERPPRLGDQPPARLGRADRFVRRAQDAASCWSTPRSMRASSRRCASRASTPGTRRMPPPSSANRNPDDYEMVTDILDVWFDSGCTHVFTLESGHWPDQRWPADLYLEGSDQHRGWFQSSLLESCGTRGRAPYDAVLTHGFTMDAKGMKMSKSLGNTVDPLEVMETMAPTSSGCGRCRSISPRTTASASEILEGVADQYRKLRNTFRYLLGALDGFSEEERLDDVAAYPELERYMLHLTAELDAKLRRRSMISTSTPTSAR